MIMKNPFDRAVPCPRALVPARAPSPRSPPATGANGTLRLRGEVRPSTTGQAARCRAEQNDPGLAPQRATGLSEKKKFVPYFRANDQMRSTRIFACANSSH